MGPVLKQYISEGKINFVYKHSAFLGQESVWAAQAAEWAPVPGHIMTRWAKEVSPENALPEYPRHLHT